MGAKSLARYFKGFKMASNIQVAGSEIESYFRDNGFDIERRQAGYYEKSKKTQNRYGTHRATSSKQIGVAFQIRTGKRIAYIIEDRFVRDNAESSLYAVEADRKVIFVRSYDKSVVYGEEFKYDPSIEIVYIPVKTASEEYADKRKKLDLMEKKRKASVAYLKTREERALYHYAVEYMIEMVEKHNQLPKFTGLEIRMEQIHPDLYYGLKVLKRSISVLKTAHQEMCNIHFNK